MIAGLLVAYAAEHGASSKAVAELIGGVTSGYTYRISADAKSLAKQFVSYLQKDLLPIFDSLPADLDLLSTKDKQVILDKIAAQSATGKWLARLLSTSTTRAVQSALAALARRLAPDLGSVIIKTPLPMESDFKQQVRKHLSRDFVIFTTDTSLLGGILVYRNGQLTDNSWLGKIRNLQTLTRH